MSRKLVIADDHEILRDGLGRLIAARCPGLELVASVGDAQSAVIACRLHQPDMIVLDIEMPGRDSLAAIREIRLSSANTKILVFTAYCSDPFISAACSCGIRGYLMKSEPVEKIIHSIIAVLNGETVFSDAVRIRLEQFRAPEHALDKPSYLDELTPREVEILRYIGKGFDNNRMADAMSLSKRTVERHVSRLMDAVGIRNRASLAQLAHKHGFVLPEAQTVLEASH